jgi:uncharacterized phiE125 gp8 family phage protein
MLTQLSTIKSRLAITDTAQDALLTSAIKAVSARFDKETNRTLARAIDITDEFFPDDTEIPVRCYPIETVTKFELKTNETEGWVEQPDVKYLIRRACVISLQSPLWTLDSALCTARVTYTAGYVLPGTTPGPGQTPLPDDLENACIEQVAYWFQNRDRIGLRTSWPSNGEYRQFAAYDLLHSVSAVLRQYQRFAL